MKRGLKCGTLCHTPQEGRVKEPSPMKRGLKSEHASRRRRRLPSEGTFPDEEGTEIGSQPSFPGRPLFREGTFPDEEGTEIRAAANAPASRSGEGTFPDEEGTEMACWCRSPPPAPGQ